MSVVVIGSYAKALVITANRIPGEGETVLGTNYRETFGGKGSDMAVQAARLGAVVAYIGVVGDDNFGREFIALMHQEGINTDGLRTSPDKPTGVGFIVKDTQGRNCIVVDMGANALLGHADIDAANASIRNAKVVLAQLEIPLETALYGLRQAKAAGATTILNPAPAVDLSHLDLRTVDILTPNQTEARIAAGLPPDAVVSNEQVARRLLATGCGAVVMTLGHAGVQIFTSEDDLRVPPYPVKVIDSNGAGDSFNAGLATALAEGQSLASAVRFANAVAALCCTRWETVPSYHRRADVEAFLTSAA